MVSLHFELDSDTIVKSEFRIRVLISLVEEQGDDKGFGSFLDKDFGSVLISTIDLIVATHFDIFLLWSLFVDHVILFDVEITGIELHLGIDGDGWHGELFAVSKNIDFELDVLSRAGDNLGFVIDTEHEVFAEADVLVFDLVYESCA